MADSTNHSNKNSVPTEAIQHTVKKPLSQFEQLTSIEISQLADDELKYSIAGLIHAGFYKLNQLKPTDPEVTDTFDKLTFLTLKTGDFDQVALHSPMSFYHHLLQIGAIEKTENGYRYNHPAGNYWPKKIEAFNNISESIPRTTKDLKKARNMPSVKKALRDLSLHSLYLQDLLMDIRTDLHLEFDDGNTPGKAIYTYYNGLILSLAESTTNLCLAQASDFHISDMDTQMDVHETVYHLLLVLGLSVPDCYHLTTDDILSWEALLPASSYALLISCSELSPRIFPIQPKNQFDLIEKALLLCRDLQSFKDMMPQIESYVKARDVLYENDPLSGVKRPLGTIDQLTAEALNQAKDFWDSGKSPAEFERNTAIDLSEVHNTLDYYGTIYTHITQLLYSVYEDQAKNLFPCTRNYFLNLGLFAAHFSSYLHEKGIPLPDGGQSSSEIDLNVEVLRRYRKNSTSTVIKESASRTTKTSAPASKPIPKGNAASSTPGPTGAPVTKKKVVRKKKRFKWLVLVLLILLAFACWKLYPALTGNLLNVRKNTADYTFLMELQDAILQREELSDDPNSTHEDLLAAEQQLFTLYETTEFETEEIKNIAEQYLQGLRLQEESLSEIHVKAQLYWQEGLVTRLRALAELKEKYGFGAQLKKNGFNIKEQLDQEEFHWEALQEIEEATRRRIQNGFSYSVENNKLRALFPSDTGYHFNIHLFFKFYDENDNLFAESDTEFLVLGKGQPSYEVDCPDSWGRCRIYWEITLLDES